MIKRYKHEVYEIPAIENENVGILFAPFYSGIVCPPAQFATVTM